MTSIAQQYAHIRSTVAVYTPGASLVAISGLERSVVLGRVLAKDSEYVEPDTARDTLILDEQGGIWDAVIHIELDSTSWLISQSRTDLADLVREAAADLDDVQVVDASGEQTAVAFEGPKAWKIAENLVDFEISSLVLHGVTAVDLPGDSGESGVLTRIGTTGEYGYLLLAPTSADPFGSVLKHAEELGGGTVEDQALARARAEVRHPQVSEQAAGLTVREANLEWLVSWGREDEFRGSAALAASSAPERGLITLRAEAGQLPAAGAAILAGDVQVGEVRVVFPSAPDAGELALGLLAKPFDVPGLELHTTAADGSAVTLTTVSSPVVVPQSWTERIGA
ncbi:glycine cleavage system aminomethyltransferase T [Kitasatospora sp. MAA4]|uniref:aminomethyl transferase family protein n=1 Tax=Kitasatospora sp. MAA4 TaxID=3035093 RepID=UPI0024742E10|nr:aminomethyl transferase family protein [Kitasatospora sp. MAA4]MDH6135324.1 glycine cleavage system aminomethyltransferase T [Kitasatospora sp. MAA4]